jgi:hypothetical protein
MGKSIDHGNDEAGLEKEAGSRFRPTTQLIRSMSLQLAIPRWVGLHQSPPPLHQQRTILAEKMQFEYENCHDSMTQAERKWLRSHRLQEARHWNLLTDLDVRNLAYASA